MSITIEVKPSSSTAQEATRETQVAVDVFADTSSQVDMAPASVAIVVETTTQPTTQVTNEDDEE